MELLKKAKEFNLLPFYLLGLLLVAFTFVLAIFLGFKNISQFKEKHSFILPSNDLLFDRQKEKKDAEFLISASSHLRDFTELFFAYDKKDCKLRVERALWMGDTSVEKIYNHLSNWFISIRQESLVTKIIWRDVESDIQIGEKKNNAFPFIARALLEIHQEREDKKTFELYLKGNLIEVSKNFPLNPHGLLICDLSYSKTTPTQ